VPCPFHPEAGDPNVAPGIARGPVSTSTFVPCRGTSSVPIVSATGARLRCRPSTVSGWSRSCHPGVARAYDELHLWRKYKVASRPAWSRVKPTDHRPGRRTCPSAGDDRRSANKGLVLSPFLPVQLDAGSAFAQPRRVDRVTRHWRQLIPERSVPNGTFQGTRFGKTGLQVSVRHRTVPGRVCVRIPIVRSSLSDRTTPSPDGAAWPTGLRRPRCTGQVHGHVGLSFPAISERRTVMDRAKRMLFKIRREKRLSPNTVSRGKEKAA